MMEQYYTILNVDKKEILDLANELVGRRLLEIARNRRICAMLMDCMANEWKGDQVYVVGDYADWSLRNKSYFPALRRVLDCYHIEGTLYHYAEHHFVKILGTPGSVPYRFVYNHKERCFLDLSHCPAWNEQSFGRQNPYLCPLILLLSMGNGLGTGDYANPKNQALVGSWCNTVSSLKITQEPLLGVEYPEFRPDFRNW